VNLSKHFTSKLSQVPRDGEKRTL